MSAMVTMLAGVLRAMREEDDLPDRSATDEFVATVLAERLASDPLTVDVFSAALRSVPGYDYGRPTDDEADRQAGDLVRFLFAGEGDGLGLNYQALARHKERLAVREVIYSLNDPWALCETASSILSSLDWRDRKDGIAPPPGPLDEDGLL